LAMYQASIKYMDGRTGMKELVNQVEKDIVQNGLDILALKGRKYPNNLAKPRKFELAAALNRLRTFKTLKC
jgi:hypothetical protein